MNILRGRASQLVPVRAVDPNGIPKAGLVFNTSGLSCVYMRELDAAPTTVTLATMTAGTWATGGFIEINGTTMPGVYQFGVPNAAVGASDASTWVVIQFVGTNIYFQPLRIDLVAYNPQDAVRIGLAALPNAAAAANGGLPTGDASNRVQANVVLMATDVITAASITADAIGANELASSAITEIQLGLATSAEIASVQSDTNDIQTRLPAALVGGRMDSNVGAMEADTITSIVIATDAFDAAAISASAVTKIQTGIESDDPLDNPVPGSYAVGTAGYNIGLIDNVKDKTDLIGSGAISATTALSPDAETISIVRRDDYIGVFALVFEIEGYPTFPSGTLAEFSTKNQYGSNYQSVDGTAEVVSGDNRVTVELERGYTAVIQDGVFDVQVTYPIGSLDATRTVVKTVRLGTVILVEDVTV